MKFQYMVCNFLQVYVEVDHKIVNWSLGSNFGLQEACWSKHLAKIEKENIGQGAWPMCLLLFLFAFILVLFFCLVFFCVTSQIQTHANVISLHVQQITPRLMYALCSKHSMAAAYD